MLHNTDKRRNLADYKGLKVQLRGLLIYAKSLIFRDELKTAIRYADKQIKRIEAKW